MRLDFSGIANLLGRKRKPQEPAAPQTGQPPSTDDLLGLLLNDPGSATGTVEPILPNIPTSTPDTGVASATVKPKQSEEVMAQLQNLFGALKEPAPALVKPQVNPIEAALEAYAISQGGATNAGGAFSLAQNRADAENAQLNHAWEARVNAAKSGLQYGVPLFNAVVDRESALDNLENKLKLAQVAGAAKQAAQEVKNNVQVRMKIGELIGANKATIPAVAQILMATGADPEMAQATAQEILADVGRNPQSWWQQYLTDKQTQAGEIAKGNLDVKKQKEAHDVLQDLGSPYSLKVQAAKDLMDMGALPAGDPYAVASEISDKAAKSAADTALTQAKTETEKVRKETQALLLKNLPKELADKHSTAVAHIAHWRFMEQMSQKGLEFKMAESARDNLVQRYGRELDSIGRDITALTADIVSLRDKRKEHEKLANAIQTKGRDKKGKLIAANPKDQSDLDRAFEQITIYDKNVADRIKQRDALQELATKVRGQIATDDLEGEVDAARQRVEAPEPQVKGGAAKPSGGQTVTGSRTGATFRLLPQGAK